MNFLEIHDRRQIFEIEVYGGVQDLGLLWVLIKKHFIRMETDKESQPA